MLAQQKKFTLVKGVFSTFECKSSRFFKLNIRYNVPFFYIVCQFEDRLS